ncbi:hypothetical protein J3D48_006205 [Pseudomonas fluorescens]|uniref:F4 family fimbrial subunit n=1 Tax=Pseudomonas fluorescens TaxID=294 RepID=UPI00209F4F5F|nr:hypothetical protein [Pseudomonas fluorescens]MCP1489795.1 hypothetical protein [Pseudomonas fluorescens]
MKMNIRYMALAAAALGLSSNAMALTFTDRDFTGGVEIGGDITVPIATNFWQWASGDAITLDQDVVTLTNDYKTMTVPATSDLPLLVGQTKAPTVGNAGSVGLNPRIAFTDAAGDAVTPVWDNTGNTGKGTITLKVTAADGTTTLGNMSMKVKAAGTAGYISPTLNVSALQVFTASSQQVFGEYALPTATAGLLLNGVTATSWANSLGGTKTGEIFMAELNTASGMTRTSWTNTGTVAFNREFNSPDQYYVGAYGLGIAEGDNIVVSFTNPVTVTTLWKAALKATVTYL